MADGSRGRTGEPQAGNDSGLCHGREFAVADLALLADLGADWLWQTDHDHRFTWISDAFAAMTGMDIGAIVGRSRLELLMKTAHGSGARAHVTLLEAHEPFRDFIYEIRDASADCRWVSISGAPQFDAHGAFTGYRGVGRNVTSAFGLIDELHDTRRKLVLAEERAKINRDEEEGESHAGRLLGALNMMTDAFCYYDENDRLVLFNAAMLEMYAGMEDVIARGVSFSELVDAGIERGIWHTGDLGHDGFRAYVLEQRRDNPHFQTLLQFCDGRWAMHREHRTSEGGTISVCTDVTELKARQEGLETARAEAVAARALSQMALDDLSRVIDSLELGVVLLDRDLLTLGINHAFYRIWRVTHDEVPVGSHFRRLMDVNRNNGIYDVSDEGWEHYVGARLDEIRAGDVAPREFVRADGCTMIYSVTMLNDGKRLVTYYDISALKKREREAETAQARAVLADRAKSEFLANMSHEIRTPMNGVMGMAELLARSELDPKQRTFVDIIVKSGQALLTIINDILDFSKIDAGQLLLDPAPFNLAEAIEDVATLVSARAKEKDLEMVVRVDPALHDTFEGDVGRIRQIITNLLGNAVKFTDSGHVLIDVNGHDEGPDTIIEVRVVDTGIGIPADKLELVFEKFSQVDASSTRRHEGTGLGLAITSRLVAMMGGDISVESEEGQGSTFRFSLRLPRAEPVRARKPMPVDVSGARILVVDDNEVNRQILIEQMAAWGFDACAACDGPEGLAVLAAAAGQGVRVDCIVLDYQMPGMTGSEVARIVRQRSDAAAQTPIIMLTSVDQSLTPTAYRRLDIDAQLIKPARSAVLLEAIVKAIQNDRAGDAPEVDEPRDIAEGSMARQRAVPAACDGHRVDILVAEDNEVNQLVFTQILGDAGFSYEIVGNGRRAVEAWSQRNPRMILMDVSMPEMGGLEATAKIRASEAPDRRVPIIGVTAHALKGDREKCMEAGMDDYLPKPISPNALIDKINRWIGLAQDAARAG